MRRLDVADASGQFNLYVQSADGGAARQLTSFSDHSVRQIAWCQGGAGLTQLTSGGQWTPAYTSPVSADGRYVLATANDRDPKMEDLLLGDLETGLWERYRRQEEGIVFAAGISPDRTMLLAGVLPTNTACQCLVASTEDSARLAASVTQELRP
jgi:hypothetical protein